MDAEKNMRMDEGLDIELDTLTIKGDPTKLYEELAKAAVDFLPVPKSSAGQIGQTKFKYAGYAKLMRCVRPALSAHGISILQPLHWRNDKAISTTIVAGHGASIASSFAFDADFRRKQKDGSVASDPQEFGRHHTYYRRYQLQAMLGLEGDADADDLPDVNEEQPQQQFSEPEKEAKAPKGKASAEKTSAPVQPTLPSSASVTEPSTTSAGASSPESPKLLNDLLASAMKELKWGVKELTAFYVENVDPAGFEKANKLTVEQKTTLMNQLVKLKGVTPF